MLNFQGAVLTQQKQPLEILTIEHSGVLEVGQVLVKIYTSGICGSQIGEIDGVKGHDKYLPHLLGHEGAGVVQKIGPGVRKVKPGDKVVLHWRPSSGIESQPPSFAWRDKKINAGLVTTLSQYSVVSENRVTIMPEEIDFETAALFGCAITTGFGVVTNDAKLKIGEALVVIGAGGIGLNIIQAASLTSAYPIIAVDLHDNRLGLAKNMGASHVINSQNLDVKALETLILEYLKNQKVDVFIDNTGIPEIIELGYKITEREGRVVLVGVPHIDSRISIHSFPLHFGKSIVGSHGGRAQPQSDIPKYAALADSIGIKFSDLISQEYLLEDVNKAISDMRSGVIAGRCIIKMFPEDI